MADAATLLSLPLFPLGTVLYPSGSLPLRIFEVRYLDMVSRCHKAGAPFGVVALTDGSEVIRPDHAGGSADGFAPETFHGTGTLATIAEFSTPQPGLMRIRCTGAQRFRITRRQRLKHGLWIADVLRLSDDAAVPVPPDLQAVADALGRVIQGLQQRADDPVELGVLPPYRLEDCGWTANRWCELLPLPLELKQRLMALDNPLLRLELVGDLLERIGVGG